MLGAEDSYGRTQYETSDVAWFSLVVVMLRVNARPHTTAATQYLIATFGWEQLDHPLYSPDLAPSDFHVLCI
jgi:hypothetical protein